MTEFEVIATGFEFAEAPRIGDDGSVYFSDLTGGGYYRCAPGGVVHTVLADRLWIGGAVLDESGWVICSGKGGLIAVDPVSGETRSILAELGGVPIVAINDIEADGRGGLFGGTVDFAAVFERGETPSGGQLFHLSATGDVSILRDGLVVSNGIGFSPDGTRLYHSESTKGIWAYTLDSNGMPQTPKLFAAIEDSDGLAVDREGGVWVCCWQSAEIRRYLPSGVLDQTITLPFPHLVSLAFGGPDMSDLYVTTGGNSDFAGKDGVVRVRSDFKGLRSNKTRLC
jgi:sugar lactone lactonase YvrE